jgi:trehalose 6-phosphate phosphatase
MSQPPVAEQPLFFLDYDGTLAPIVDQPMDAVPHPDVPDLLTALAERYPLWVITGRHLRDLEVLLKLPLPAVGLHGTQQGTIGESIDLLMPETAVAALARLRAAVPKLEGVMVEDKDPSFAVHYRNVEDPGEARRRLQTWATDVPDGLDTIWGKKVVEVRPHGFDKGVAVERLAAKHPGHTPLYLGDDVTDEDAFAALDALDRETLTIKVGEGETRARYRLPDVEAVVAYLQRYL